MTDAPEATPKTAAELVDDLPDLTEKQQAFVEAILSGMGVKEAYCASRDVSRMTDNVIRVNATREHYRPNVQAWLRAARLAKLGKIVSTKEDHEAELVRAREFAYEQQDPKAVIAAEVSRGRLNGLYVDRSEVTVYDPASILEQIRAAAPEVAAALATRFNVPGFKQIDLVPISQTDGPAD